MTTTLTKKDFVSDQEVRWCPGCGDYAILSAVQQVFPTLGIPRENFVIISGIGCSSRLPYYVDTYGFHTIHGRAPAVATGVKIANPELSVWIATGDGDGLSIGGNHLIHTMRRNVDVNILLFDNRIYGLTKGQYSPTSEFGKKTKSTPFGSVDRPFNPVALALGANATFVARTVDIFAPHLKETLVAANDHKGTAFLQIFQNCNIFNDHAFDDFTKKAVRDDSVLLLKHGEPMIFGKNRDKGIRMTAGSEPEVVELGNGTSENELIVHDEKGSWSYAFMLAHMEPPEFPMPLGVIRRVDGPTVETAIAEQIRTVTDQKGAGDLRTLLYSRDVWEVK
jgi:2-oxoglutarate ferredoxin oxidoreductase subunit beta